MSDRETALIEQMQAAQQSLYAACQDGLRMSIPARATATDLVISAALGAAVDYLKSVALSTPDAQVCAWREMETAPKDGTQVLLWFTLGHAEVGVWRDDTWMTAWNHDVLPNPTLWMPIPPVVGTAPQGGEQ